MDWWSTEWSTPRTYERSTTSACERRKSAQVLDDRSGAGSPLLVGLKRGDALGIRIAAPAGSSNAP
jgi:hypothetical protein